MSHTAPHCQWANPSLRPPLLDRDQKVLEGRGGFQLPEASGPKTQMDGRWRCCQGTLPLVLRITGTWPLRAESPGAGAMGVHRGRTCSEQCQYKTGLFSASRLRWNRCKGHVCLPYTILGRAEGSCRSINPSLDRWMAVHSPTNFSGAGCTPAKQDLEKKISTCSVQMGYSGLQPWCWAVSTIPQGPWDQGRVHHQVLGFLMKTVAWVPPAGIRPGSTRWGLLGFCTKASKGESASSPNTRI